MKNRPKLTLLVATTALGALVIPIAAGANGAGWFLLAASAVQADDAPSDSEQPEDENAPNAAETTEGDPAEIVKGARERLSEYRSIKSDVEQTVNFGPGRRFKATGRYLQGADLQLRLEFAVQIGNVEGSLLQVSDGEDLWTRYRFGGDTRLTLRKVRQILQAARQQGLSTENLMVVELGLGGLPAMIAAIEEANTFDTLRTETVDGQELTVVEGTWSEEYRTAFEQSNFTESPHFADRVRLYFDENLFPRRIRYLRNEPEANLLRPLVTLDFVNAEVGGPIDESKFEFEPPTGVFPNDVTNQYLQKLQPGGTPTPGR